MHTNSFIPGLNHGLQHSAQFYYLLTGVSGIYIHTNPLFRQTFLFHPPGENNLQNFEESLEQEERLKYQEALKQCLLDHNIPVQATLSMKHCDGKTQLVDWEFSVVTDKNGSETIQAIGTNPSRQVNTQGNETLKENEYQFRNLVHNLKQGILVQQEDGKLILCNGAALEMLGITEDQLLGKDNFHSQWNIFYGNDKTYSHGSMPWQLVKETQSPLRDEVIKVCRPLTNDLVWLLVNADPVLNSGGTLSYVICSFTDITEQKKLAKLLTEQAIQKQKQITQATIDAQEKERMLIGKELHDNISQHLTTTRLYLEVAKEKTGGEMKDMVSFSHKNLVSIIHEIRSLSQSLVPPTLGDIGLVESIQDLSDTIKKEHNISVDLYCRHFEEVHLPDNLKLMLFRVIQEQLNNITRHSGAANAEVRLQLDAESITLTISDDRAGNDIHAYRNSPVFENIVNRVSLFNGHAEKDMEPGGRCILTVNVPVPVPETVEN